MAILNKPLNYGGRLFEVGDNIRGQVPLDMIQLLKKEGVVSEEEVLKDQELPSGGATAVEQLKTVEELAEHLKILNDAESVQSLLDEEQGKDKPRAGAVKLLEARLKEIQDERV
ncbi:hypothetical protein ACIOBL_13035 [Paenibacillus taichungensis]|uniref:hypothetical protein n=1 Tax=Paenibacillus taichungensis TaxID=484184 RepID=UPI003822285E